MSYSKLRRMAAAMAAAAVLLLVALLGIAYSHKRAAELMTRGWIVQVLQQRFHSDVELEDFRVSGFPRMKVTGKGLSLHYWKAMQAPPLIRVEEFSFELGFLGIFRAPHHIQR